MSYIQVFPCFSVCFILACCLVTRKVLQFKSIVFQVMCHCYETHIKWSDCHAQPQQHSTEHGSTGTHSHSQTVTINKKFHYVSRVVCALSVPAFLVHENIIHMAVIINIQFSSYFNLHHLALKSPCNHCILLLPLF